MRAYLHAFACLIRPSPQFSWVPVTKYLGAPGSFGHGFCTVGDSLGGGWKPPLVVSQAFEHLIALHSHDEGNCSSLQPIERPICGLFMTTTVNTARKTSCTPQARTNFGLGQTRNHDLSLKSPDATPLDHATPVCPHRIWHKNRIRQYDCVACHRAVSLMDLSSL